MGIAKLKEELVGCDAKVMEDAEEWSRSSDRRSDPSMLLLSEAAESEEFFDLPDIPPIGRLLLAMLFTS